MTYLVTGGTGFIGSRIVRNLVREGEQVVVYDWNPERIALTRLLSTEEINTHVKIVQGDVTDYVHLTGVIKQYNCEKVVHLAALLLHDVNANPALALKLNCEGYGKCL